MEMKFEGFARVFDTEKNSLAIARRGVLGGMGYK